MRGSGWRTAGLILLTVMVLLVVAVVYIARSLRINAVHGSSGDDVSIQLPAGHLNVRTREHLDPGALGIPMYPDAKRTKDRGGAAFEWTSRDGADDKTMEVAAADYVTGDSAAQVFAWYRSQLPNWVVSVEKNAKSTHLELAEGGYKRIVSVQEESDGTHIGVATVGKPESN